MTTIDNDLRRQVAVIICCKGNCVYERNRCQPPDNFLQMADATISLVLERAALVADQEVFLQLKLTQLATRCQDEGDIIAHGYGQFVAIRIAKGIRALGGTNDKD